MKKFIIVFLLLSFLYYSCRNRSASEAHIVGDYVKIPLKADLSRLTEKQKHLIELLIRITDYIDSIYFYENFGNPYPVLDTITDSLKRELFLINFGPWNMITMQAFIKGFGKKPLGGNFYPYDITMQEFLKSADADKSSHYTFIRRDSSNNLYSIPYHVMLKKYTDTICSLLIEASKYTENERFREYLNQIAIDLKADNYYKSDSLWVLIRNNLIDFVVGPLYIATDKLMDLKADHIAMVLIKDTIWTQKVQKYNVWLKYLQKALPVPPEYKEEKPGDASSITVYDAIAMGGSAKVSGTLMSIVLPSLDQRVSLNVGMKNIQFKNVIEYKSKYIVKPLAKEILPKENLQYITSNAFFVNTIMWEIGNSLGLKNTINGKGTVREALKETATIIEYVKNNLMSLYLVNRLAQVDEIQNDLKENYYTFVVDLIRALRFGKLNNYSKANLITLNYFFKTKAIKIGWDNKIRIQIDKFKTITDSLIRKIIVMQGNGDYKQAKSFIKQYNYIPPELYNLLQKVNSKHIPVDIYPVNIKLKP